MKKISLLTVLIFAVGCSTVPSIRVSQPWLRSLKSGQLIESNKSLKIEVSGTTSPLIGNEQLTSDKLHSYLGNLLIRRGFIINNTTYAYDVKLSYRTTRSEKMRMVSSMNSVNAYAIYESAGVISSNLGVSTARAVSALTSRSGTVSTQELEQVVSYTHTISIELSNREGELLWKGESTWDNQELNLLNRIIPALQLLLSDLPSDKSYRPEIPEIKDTHVENYYRLACQGQWFTCPALPYKIEFPHDRSHKGLSIIPDCVKNQNALAAYIDLLQTAEYALPRGNEKDWEDPLEISLWTNVTLGGQYYLGPTKAPTNVIIELAGQSDGYYIDECRTVTEQEYSDFNKHMEKWREMLSNYFDVYKKK